MNKTMELIESLKKDILESVTTELTTEQSEKLVGFTKKLDEIGEEHKKTEDAYVDIKGKYIEGLKTFGTKVTPVDEEKPKSLEEIAEEISKSSK